VSVVVVWNSGRIYSCAWSPSAYWKRHSGPVLISGYASPMYDHALAGWNRATTTTTDQLSQVKREVLWMNFEPQEQMRIEL